LRVLIGAGVAQSDNRLLSYYNWLFTKATPECPNLVELNLTGGCRYLITREPEHVKTILTSKFADFGKGPEFHRLWRPFLGDSIFTTDHELWHNSRSLIRPMFMKSRVSDLDIFERWTAVMIEQFPKPGVTFDVMDLFYRMTIDVTTEFLLGTSVNSLENPTSKFVEAFRDVQRIQMLLTVLT
jgi:cytochrome P450